MMTPTATVASPASTPQGHVPESNLTLLPPQWYEPIKAEQEGSYTDKDQIFVLPNGSKVVATGSLEAHWREALQKTQEGDEGIRDPQNASYLPYYNRPLQQEEIKKVKWSQLWLGTMRGSCFKISLFSSLGMGLTASFASFYRRRNVMRAMDWLMYSVAGTFIVSFPVCQTLNTKYKRHVKEVYRAANM